MVQPPTLVSNIEFEFLVECKHDNEYIVKKFSGKEFSF